MNLCDAGPAVRDAQGKFLYWNSSRQQVNVQYGPSDTIIAAYRVMRFNGKGQQTDDVRCIVKDGDAAKGFITTIMHSTPNTIRSIFPVSNIEDGTWCWILYDGSLDCDGTRCTPAAAMRSHATSSMAAEPAGWERVNGNTASAGAPAYWCDDGDYLIDQGSYFQIMHPNSPGYGGCGEDSTWVESIRHASLCEANEVWIDHEGEEGSAPEGVTDYAGPDIGPNANNFWAPKNYTKGTNFIIDCKDQYSDNHFFTVTTASFQRIGNSAKDNGPYGYRARYQLTGFGTVTPTTDSRDNFLHGNVIPINSTLYSIGGGNYSGGFTQGDRAACKWYGPHRLH